jgi:NAD-specific glutamate dehydrogenase
MTTCLAQFVMKVTQVRKSCLCQRDGSARVLAGGGGDADTLLARWQEQHAVQLAGLEGLVSELRTAKQMDLAMLLVAVRMLKGVVTVG